MTGGHTHEKGRPIPSLQESAKKKTLTFSARFCPKMGFGSRTTICISCNKYLGQPRYNTWPHARLPPSFMVTDAWMTSQLNVALIRKLCGPLKCLAYFFGMLSMGVCTTRHWQTSGPLVQELNDCTVSVRLHLTVTRLHGRCLAYRVYWPDCEDTGHWRPPSH